VEIIPQADLPFSRIARELQGEEHGGVGISLLLIEAEPGDGPGLHRHAYPEVFVVQEGEATFTVGEEERPVAAGHLVIVPPNRPHRFVSTGDVTLRQIAIHVSPRFATEWLDG
jgi:mannose-6-phosphate isomerase-like protein (cupin superfamily)